jgi:hypothetical protein
MIPPNSDLINWWALMQHYSAPTRLLDWTASPYIALYFAVVEEWKKPGAVWTIDYREKIDDSLEGVRRYFESSSDHHELFWHTPDLPNFCFFCDLATLHARSSNQQGFFSVCGRIPCDHGVLLEGTDEGRRDFRKLIIKPKLKSVFLNKIMQMNIGPHSLFGGLDGLGGTIRNSIRLQVCH